LMGRAFLQALLPLFKIFLPFSITFGVIFLIYRYVPGQRPGTGASLTAAFLCALAIILLHMLFSRIFTAARFNLIYGVLGSLVLMVLWVYFSFLLFFFFAEVAFVSERIDALALERLYLYRLKQDRRTKRIETFLFSHPRRIFEKYARRYPEGELLFREGENSTDIYFIYQGRIGITRLLNGGEQKIATLEEGELFGEMAYLMREHRTATAVAETEATVLMISPAIFDELLNHSRTVSRNVIHLLTDRLRKTQLAPKP